MNKAIQGKRRLPAGKRDDASYPSADGVGRLLLALAIGALTALSACARSEHGPVAVRVGDSAITQGAVHHWAGVIARGGLEVTSSSSGSVTPKERALEFLISSAWLSREAAARGVGVGGQEVDRQLTDRRVSNGEDEFQANLDSTGKTVPDVRLEIETASAAAHLRDVLSHEAANVSRSEILTYYQTHAGKFRVLPHREIDLIETFTTRAAALAFKRRVGLGPRFASMAFHESIQRGYEFGGTAAGQALEKAIFATRPGVLKGPLKVHDTYVLFVVRRITPARIEPLAAVKPKIVKQLTEERYQAGRAELVAGMRRRWVARTHCAADYAAQQCGGYSRAVAQVDDLLENG